MLFTLIFQLKKIYIKEVLRLLKPLYKLDLCTNKQEK